MKLFVCIALVILAYAAANPASGAIVASSGSSSSAKVQEADSEVQQQVVPVSLGDLTRLRKSAYGSGSSGGHSGASSGGYSGASSGGYGGSSMQAPACPKNYVFSCQPSLSPIACSSHSSHPSSYGSSGAYSAPVPTYVNPLRGNYGVPQGYSATAYVPQGFGFNPNNQYYQY